jgi:hypothetical protein
MVYVLIAAAIFTVFMCVSAKKSPVMMCSYLAAWFGVYLFQVNVVDKQEELQASYFQYRMGKIISAANTEQEGVSPMSPPKESQSDNVDF